jgi:hypothetical protein
MRQSDDFVLVLYEGEIYPGKVTCSTQSGALEKSWKYWKLPKFRDELKYCLSDIVKKINIPKVISQRGIFDVPEICEYRKN